MAAPNWIENSSIELKGCKAAKVEYGQGLVATEASAVDQVLVRVPKEMLVNARRVVEYAEDKPLLKTLLHTNDKGDNTDEIELSPRKIIARFLLYQILAIRRGTPDVMFAGWVQSMPPGREIGLPFTWEDHDIQTLENTSIFEATVAKKHVLAVQYKGLFSGEKLREQVKDYVNNGPLAKELKEVDFEVTFNDWILVEEWIASRAIAYPDEDEQDISLAMVPVVDLCNHKSTANALYRVTADGSGEIELVAVKDVEKDAEITINYGPQTGSGEFLFNYGFIPSDHTTAKKASFFYGLYDVEFRKCIDPGFEPKAVDNPDELPEEEQTYQILVAFYDRKQSRITFSHEEEDGPATWIDEFIVMYCCGDEVSLVRNEETGYFELHFRDQELDLENIDDCIKSRDEKFYNEVVRPRGNAIVNRMIAKFFLCEPAADVKPEHHKLFSLEQRLLKAVQENCQNNHPA